MTTRRDFLTLVGTGGALVLAGCTSRATRTAPPDAAAALPDTLLLETADGLGMLRRDGLHAVGAAAVTPDAATAFIARPADGITEVLAVEVATGHTETLSRLRGTWVPRVASRGMTVALTAPGSGDAGYAPAGRTTTSIMVSGLSGQLLLDLPGNYVPDAFAGDNTSLYVLDWLPAGAPDRYRVREVNFGTRAPTPLYTRDKQPVSPADEEKMTGRRRTAVWSPGRDILYSLYTNQPGTTGTEGGRNGGDGEGGGHTEWDSAFIHTLALDQHWAFCVDLPEPFGSHPNAAHALAGDPGGSHLYVVDAAAGKVAEVSTDTLAVTRVAGFAPMTGDAYADATGDVLYIGAGSRVLALDTRSLDQAASWPVGGPVSGLARSYDLRRVYVTRPGAVDWWDTAGGARAGSVPVPALRGLRGCVPHA